MFPTTPFANVINSYWRNLEPLRQHGWMRIAFCPDRPNVRFRELCETVCLAFHYLFGVCLRSVFAALSHQPNAARVFHVIRMGDVFKVCHSVVLLNAVLVINRVGMLARSKKGPRYEGMDVLNTAHAVSRQIKHQIMTALSGSQELPRFAIRSLRRSGVSRSANTPQVGDFVQVFPTDDGSPFFTSEFFGGKVLNNQDRNLHRLGFVLARLDHLRKQVFEPFAFYHNVIAAGSKV